VRVKQSSETGRLWRPRHLPTVGCGGVLGRRRPVEALQLAGTGPPGRYAALPLDGRSPNPPVACRSDPDPWSSSPPPWQKPGAPRVSCGWSPTRGRAPSCRIRRALRGDRAARTCSPSHAGYGAPGLSTKETAGLRRRFKLAPSGRAGVRAMKGPQRFERREAPIRCGFARTYVPTLTVRYRGTLTRPGRGSITTPGY
jgi:hypothetical protein